MYLRNHHPNPGAVPSGRQPEYDHALLNVYMVDSNADIQCENRTATVAEASYFIDLDAGDWVWAGWVWSDVATAPPNGWLLCGYMDNGQWRSIASYRGKAKSTRFELRFTLDRPRSVKFNIATPNALPGHTNVKRQVIATATDYAALTDLKLPYDFFTGNTMPLVGGGRAKRHRLAARLRRSDWVVAA